MIPDWKIKKLTQLGIDFKCPFLSPPFQGNTKEASFEIHKFKETKEFQDFLTHIKSLDIPFEYAKHNNKIFLVLSIEEAQV